MAMPPSLGDSKPSEYKVIREEVPLPSGRKAIVAAVATILDKGGVQRLVVEVGKPIAVSRAVNANEVPDGLTPEAPDDDVIAAIRNGQIVELDVDDYTVLHHPESYSSMFMAFELLKSKGVRAKLMMFHSMEDAKDFLGVGASFDLTEAFGVPIGVSLEVPEDAALLVGSSVDDLVFTKAITIRIPGYRSQSV